MRAFKIEGRNEPPRLRKTRDCGFTRGRNMRKESYSLAM